MSKDENGQILYHLNQIRGLAAFLQNEFKDPDSHQYAIVYSFSTAILNHAARIERGLGCTHHTEVNMDYPFADMGERN